MSSDPVANRGRVHPVTPPPQVLLTGANGFVGSHILDVLRAEGMGVRALLRPGSDRSFIQSQLPGITVCDGSIGEPDALDRALQGASHVIHCAGATRALGARGFFEVNEAGTRHVVDAVNRHGSIRRLAHISSLAAVGAATRERPLTDADPPRPNSTYGLSKLAAEEQVRERCRTEFTILRPPAVYGPRDREFLRLFKAVRSGFKPVFGDGSQELHFVYAPDLARAAVHCLTAPGAAGQSFFVAEQTQITSRGFGDLVAGVLGCRARMLRIPVWALYALCVGQDLASQVTRRASVLSRHKFGEFRAEALTCDATPLKDRTGFTCPTDLKTGLLRTLEWYRTQGWIS